MVTDIVDAHLGQARCRFGRYIHHSRISSLRNASDESKGCDHGQCGACTVHVNARRVRVRELPVKIEGLIA